MLKSFEWKDRPALKDFEIFEMRMGKDSQTIQQRLEANLTASKHHTVGTICLIQGNCSSIVLLINCLQQQGNLIFSKNLDIENDIYITDPPYGDVVKYEEITEFFTAWLCKNLPPEFAHWTWDSQGNRVGIGCPEPDQPGKS